MWSNDVTHMLVLSGVWVAFATSAMPVMPEVGSSRYSRSTSRSLYATRREVSTDQIAFGSIRSCIDGPNRSRRSCIVSTSRSGSRTPPLTLMHWKPQRSTHFSASSDHRLGREHLAPLVVAGLLVEEVGCPRHPLADDAAQQVADGPAGLLAHQVEARLFERREEASVPEGDPERLKLPGVHADDVAARRLERRHHRAAARCLAEPFEAVVGLQLDDDPHVDGLVDAPRVAERRDRGRRSGSASFR